MIYPIFVSGSSTEGIRTWIWPVVSLSDGLDNACLSIRHMAQLLQACNAMQTNATDATCNTTKLLNLNWTIQVRSSKKIHPMSKLTSLSRHVLFWDWSLCTLDPGACPSKVKRQCMLDFSDISILPMHGKCSRSLFWLWMPRHVPRHTNNYVKQIKARTLPL